MIKQGVEKTLKQGNLQSATLCLSASHGARWGKLATNDCHVMLRHPMSTPKLQWKEMHGEKITLRGSISQDKISE